MAAAAVAAAAVAAAGFMRHSASMEAATQAGTPAPCVSVRDAAVVESAECARMPGLDVMGLVVKSGKGGPGWPRCAKVGLCECQGAWSCITSWWCQSEPQWCQPQAKPPPKSAMPNPKPKYTPGPG